MTSYFTYVVIAVVVSAIRKAFSKVVNDSQAQATIRNVVSSTTHPMLIYISIPDIIIISIILGVIWYLFFNNKNSGRIA
ncbi:MAG: hypothetical protein ACTSVB_09270 [Candidatus Heimdallarchaeaceae archaeon]